MSPTDRPVSDRPPRPTGAPRAAGLPSCWNHRVSRSTARTCPSGPTWAASQRAIDPPPVPISRQRAPGFTPMASQVADRDRIERLLQALETRIRLRVHVVHQVRGSECDDSGTATTSTCRPSTRRDVTLPFRTGSEKAGWVAGWRTRRMLTHRDAVSIASGRSCTHDTREGDNDIADRRRHHDHDHR